MSCGWLIVGKIQLCVFRLFTGLPCPGCGLCHAGMAMLKGRWLESFRFHPLLIPVLFTLSVAAFSKYGFFRRVHSSRFFYPAMLVLVLALYIVRMILFFPDGPVPMVWDGHSFAGKILPLLKSLF